MTWWTESCAQRSPPIAKAALPSTLVTKTAFGSLASCRSGMADAGRPLLRPGSTLAARLTFMPIPLAALPGPISA